MSQDEAPKIIVDTDWKSEAQREKEKLTEQAAEAKAQAPGGAGQPGQGRLPEADFRTLMSTLLTPAIMSLGGMADPQTGKAMVSLEEAKFYIDLLAVLEEKCAGNLTEEESKELSGLLNELRMRYVEVSKLVAEAIAKQGGAGGVDLGAAPPPQA